MSLADFSAPTENFGLRQKGGDWAGIFEKGVGGGDLTLFTMMGGICPPPNEKSAVIGRKNENFQK